MTGSKKIRLGNPFSKLTAMWADAKKHEDRLMVAFGAVFAFAGTLAAIAGIFSLFGSVGIAVNGARAEGTVTDIKVSSSSTSTGGTSYYPIVSFRARNEQMYTFTPNSSDSELKIGDKVSVLYNSSNPGEARIDSFWNLWGVGLLLLLMGLIFAGAGVGIAGPIRRFMSKDHFDTFTSATVKGKREPREPKKRRR